MIISENIYKILPTAHEIIKDFNVQYRMLGGTALQALINIDSLDETTKSLFVNQNLELPNIRDNGTLRDIDYLVLSTDNAKISAIKYSLNKELGNQAAVSVFGLNHYEQQIERPYPIKMLDFTSDRLIDNQGKLYYYCHPALSEVSLMSYEEWQIVVDDKYTSLPTLSPEALRAAYYIRSIGGLRPRDKIKLNKLDNTIEKYWPDHMIYRETNLREWYYFKNLMESSFNEVGVGFVARRSLMKFLDSKKWAIDIAQGGGFLGKNIQPILGKIIHEAVHNPDLDNYGLKSYLGSLTNEQDLAEELFPANESKCY